MEVDTGKKNPILKALLFNETPEIAMDANIMIPPNRKERAFPSKYHFNHFLFPLLTSSIPLIIHESILEELVEPTIKNKVIRLIEDEHYSITLIADSCLSEEENLIRSTIEIAIAPYTQYNPSEDNKEDRGEVKTLSYLATKGRGCFLSKDTEALNLITNAKQLETSLDALETLTLYEIIYYMFKTHPEHSKTLRALYKYNYHLTEIEKHQNPDWEHFIQTFDEIYGFSKRNNLYH